MACVDFFSILNILLLCNKYKINNKFEVVQVQTTRWWNVSCIYRVLVIGDGRGLGSAGWVGA